MTTSTRARPEALPARPHFSSGPCAKRPGWTPDALSDAVLGRSHRSKLGKARLQAAIDKTRAVLQVPDTHLVGIVPGSDTGAVEMAMWSMLGAKPVQLLAFESFGKDWATDAVKQLKLDAEVLDAPYGELPDLARVKPDADLVFTWNGTTSGVRVPDADFISDERTGITICDATSACFAQSLDWAKLDVVTFSWQKALGGEAAHGGAGSRPSRRRAAGGLQPALAASEAVPHDERRQARAATSSKAPRSTRPPCCACRTISTPLGWAEGLGGLTALVARADANLAVLERWVEATPLGRLPGRDEG